MIAEPKFNSHLFQQMKIKVFTLLPQASMLAVIFLFRRFLNFFDNLVKRLLCKKAIVIYLLGFTLTISNYISTMLAFLNINYLTNWNQNSSTVFLASYFYKSFQCVSPYSPVQFRLTGLFSQQLFLLFF